MKIVMKLCTSFGTRLGAQVRDFSVISDRNYIDMSWITSSLVFTRGINRGYYMAAQGHEISPRVLKHISGVSAPFRTVL